MTATSNRSIPGDLFARTQTITGLRQLADYLETHPDVPVNEYGCDYTVYANGDTGSTNTDAADIDAAGRDEVDRIAEILGVTPTDDTARGGHYRVCKTFGRISYRAVYIPTRAWARREAEDSYHTNISHSLDQDRQPDQDPQPQPTRRRDEAA